MSKKMADFSKLKKKKKDRFGDLPTIEETQNNLEAPETAPIARKTRKKTDRTEPLNFKVTAEFKKEFKTIAFEQELKQVELLEKCLELYKKHEITK